MVKLNAFLVGLAALGLVGTKAYAKDISIHFGYIDQRPYDMVLDATLSKELILKLQQTCQNQSQKACGFDLVFSQGQMNLLIRDNHEITILTSSVTDSDSSNRNGYLLNQKEVSRKSQILFLESLRSRDAIVYVGHSRFGSGPDFLFPTLRADGTVDKQYYQLSHQGGQIAARALSESTKAYQEISLISCDAESHFAQSLTKSFPEKKFYFAKGL